MSKALEVKQQMLIRRPAAEVCEAFVDPRVTTKFWFTKSSGRLEQGKRVQWEWEMYGVKVSAHVLALEPGKRLCVEMSTATDPSTQVEWLFNERQDQTTLVQISHRGFTGDEATVTAKALDSMGGFTFLLASSKAWLEHGIELKVVADHVPLN
jgi:uncharacterized protein YndB with AHSA1/START domain